MCVANTRRNFRPTLFNSDGLYQAPPAEPEPLKTGSACGTEPTSASSLPVAAPFRGNERPKKSRHALPPGKTAKNHDRHFVVHCYHDHAQDELHGCQSVPALFPIKLHEVLDEVKRDGLDSIISWAPHGRCFVIHQPKEFVEQILPKYFRQTKLTSFQRQLNLYGFNRLTRGKDSGGYYHEFFLRGKPTLCRNIVRSKVKGTGTKAASNPNQEPNLYSLPPVVSDCDSSKASLDISDATLDSFCSLPQLESSTSLEQHVTEASPTSAFDPCGTSKTMDSDDVTAAILDDLFFDDISGVGGDAIDMEELNDFCADWSPLPLHTGPGDEVNIEATLEKDWLLAFMLQHLLD